MYKYPAYDLTISDVNLMYLRSNKGRPFEALTYNNLIRIRDNALKDRLLRHEPLSSTEPLRSGASVLNSHL